jgi:hypothetical protein
MTMMTFKLEGSRRPTPFGYRSGMENVVDEGDWVFDGVTF